MSIYKEYIPQYSEYVDHLVIQWAIIVEDVLPRVERDLTRVLRLVSKETTNHKVEKKMDRLKARILRNFSTLISEFRSFITLSYGPLFKYVQDLKDRNAKKKYTELLQRYFTGNPEKKEPPLYKQLADKVWNAKSPEEIKEAFEQFHEMLMDISGMLAEAGLFNISRAKVDIL